MPDTRIWGAALLVSFIASQSVQAQTPIPPSPKDFVAASLQSDRYEMLAATVAAAQSQDARVQAFAREMKDDHSRLSADVRQAAMTAGVPVSEAGLSGDQAQLLAGLQGVRGSDFDKTYARQQVLAHAQALAVEESFAAAGGDPTLRKAAQAALPTIRDHWKKAEALYAQVGGS